LYALCWHPGAGGVAYFYLQRSSTPFPPEVVSTVPPPSIEQPGPTDLPVIPEPTSSGSSLTGNQQLDENRLFDDFSSDALGWPVVNDGKTILKYEDGQYSFQIAEPDYFDWAYVPVDFSPIEISFDVKSDVGPQNGTFGVFCRFQDADNQYYIEFDSGDPAYLIGEYVNGEDIRLTPEGSQGDHWQETSTLYSASGAVNHIGISCHQDYIILFINGEYVTEAAVQTPIADPGDMAFFVYASPDAGSNGYKVFFDNVEAYKSVQ
jgi:hypothetical protein